MHTHTHGNIRGSTVSRDNTSKICGRELSPLAEYFVFESSTDEKVWHLTTIPQSKMDANIYLEPAITALLNKSPLHHLINEACNSKSGHPKFFLSDRRIMFRLQGKHIDRLLYAFKEISYKARISAWSRFHRNQHNTPLKMELQRYKIQT